MLIDLSHTVEHGMITYKGLPAPIVCDYLSREASRKLYAPGTEFHIGKIEMVANTGTYLDSPFHRDADGKDLSELPLERLADLEAVVVRWDRQGRAVGVSAIGRVLLNHACMLPHHDEAELDGSIAEGLFVLGFEVELAGLPGQKGSPEGTYY